MTNRDKLEISLIIPAYNEVERLPAFLEECRAYLNARYPHAYEILVVDDGSSDGTAALVEEMLGPEAVLRLPRNQGKGSAVRAGMLAAKGKIRLFADADGATPITEEAKLAEAISRGSDIAIGSRAAPGGIRRWQIWSETESSVNASSAVWRVRPHRHLIGRVFSALVKWAVSLPFEDTQCGFKMFRAEAAKAIFGAARSERFAFDVEALYLGGLMGFAVAEIPVSWHEVAGSKVRLGRDAWQMFLEIRRVRKWHAPLAAKALAAGAQRRSA